MTFGLLLLIALLAAACSALRWRGAGKALYALATLLFLGIGCGYVPGWLLDPLQTAYDAKPAPAWAQRNAIVVLGGGTEKIGATGRIEPGAAAYARIAEAAALQRDCRAHSPHCKILLSGGDARQHGSPDAAVYRQALLALGLAGDDVLIEPYSTSTWQHARFASDVLQHFARDRVVLVSSGVHLRRSQLYFAHFGIDALQARAGYLNAVKSPLPLAHNFMATDAALHEYIDMARYRARIATGELARSRAGDAASAAHSDAAGA